MDECEDELTKRERAVGLVMEECSRGNDRRGRGDGGKRRRREEETLAEMRITGSELASVCGYVFKGRSD